MTHTDYIIVGYSFLAAAVSFGGTQMKDVARITDAFVAVAALIGRLALLLLSTWMLCQGAGWL